MTSYDFQPYDSESHCTLDQLIDILHTLRTQYGGDIRVYGIPYHSDYRDAPLAPDDVVYVPSTQTTPGYIAIRAE